MKQLTGTLLLIVCLPLLAAAQGSEYSRGHGYFYVAPGVATEWESTVTLHIGGGAEGFPSKYVGVGADAGYIAQFEDYTNVSTFSLYAVGRFRPKTSDNRLEPFVAGGYTHFSGLGTPNGINFGGGVNYWFADHVGLRCELRDNARGSRPLHHFVGFRIGLTFR
jgi:hypothetical protein